MLSLPGLPRLPQRPPPPSPGPRGRAPPSPTPAPAYRTTAARSLSPKTGVSIQWAADCHPDKFPVRSDATLLADAPNHVGPTDASPRASARAPAHDPFRSVPFTEAQFVAVFPACPVPSARGAPASANLSGLGGAGRVDAGALCPTPCRPRGPWIRPGRAYDADAGLLKMARRRPCKWTASVWLLAVVFVTGKVQHRCTARRGVLAGLDAVLGLPVAALGFGRE